MAIQSAFPAEQSSGPLAQPYEAPSDEMFGDEDESGDVGGDTSAPAAYTKNDEADNDELFDGPEKGPDVSHDDDTEWDEDTLAEAEEYGFDADTARAFGSKDNLARALAAFDREYAKIGRQYVPQNPPAVPQEQQYAPDQYQYPDQHQEAVTGQWDKYKVDLDPEVYDETTLKVVNGLNDHYDALARYQEEQIMQQRDFLLALHEQFSGIAGQKQTEESAKFEGEMESFFDSISDQYSEEFGKGHWSKLPPGSAQVQARAAFVEEMRALRVADEIAGRPKAGNATMQKRALRSLYSDKIKTNARKEILGEVGKRRGQAIARPSSRSATPADATKSAVRRVSEILRKRGIYDSDDGFEL